VLDVFPERILIPGSHMSNYFSFNTILLIELNLTRAIYLMLILYPYHVDPAGQLSISKVKTLNKITGVMIF